MSERIVAWAASIVVVVIVAVGLYIVGLPETERLRRLDAHRVSDLRLLSEHIRLYADEHGELPEDLDALLAGTRLSRLPRDPGSDASYAYEPSEQTYELCATFDRVADEPDHFWNHPVGTHCFELKAGVDTD